MCQKWLRDGAHLHNCGLPISGLHGIRRIVEFNLTEVIGILGFAVLFAVFGLLRGRVQESKECSNCGGQDDPGACDSCNIVCDISESYHA